MASIQGRVRFEDVEFAYTPEKPVLHGISFRAEPGTVTALVVHPVPASPPSSA